MTTSLAIISHSTPDVAVALRNDRWQVFFSPAATATSPPPSAEPICGVRTKAGQLQVRLLRTQSWQNVAAADQLFQQ